MRKRLGKSQAAVTEEGWTLRWSGTYEVYGDRWMPAWVEFTFGGIDQPQVRGRIEVRNWGTVELVALQWSCAPHQRAIRESDLRGLQLDALVTDLVASLSFRHEYRRGAPLPEPPERMTEHDPAFEAARRFVTPHRKPRDYRVMNFPVLLYEIARIYRDNIDHAPTQAVADAFGVKIRMASIYVDRARQAGYLPPTTQGKKKA